MCDHAVEFLCISSTTKNSKTAETLSTKNEHKIKVGMFLPQTVITTDAVMDDIMDEVLSSLPFWEEINGRNSYW